LKALNNKNKKQKSPAKVNKDPKEEIKLAKEKISG